MSDYLAGKSILITGGGSGIGRALARYAAARGAQVTVNDLGTSPQGEGADMTPAETVVAEIRDAGGAAVANGDDVSTWKTASSIVACAVDTFGHLDAVVNCAGIQRHAAFEKMEPENFERVLDIHVKGTFFVSRAAAPHFVAQQSGSYLHMSSTTGLIGSMGVTNYGTAKAGIAGLSRLIAFDMARYNVTSNCMAPSARSRQWEIINRFRAEEFDRPGANEEGFQKFRSTQGTNEQIAPVAAYLISDAAREITGQIIGVRGNEVYLYSQPAPIRSIHRSDGWTLETLDEQLFSAFRPSLTPLETYGQVFSWPTL